MSEPLHSHETVYAPHEHLQDQAGEEQHAHPGGSNASHSHASLPAMSDPAMATRQGRAPSKPLWPCCS